MGKDFRVDTTKLADVAERVEHLLQGMSGTHGFFPGNKMDLDAATGDAIGQALGAGTSHPMDGDGNGGSAFAKTYGFEHQGMVATYQALIDQLTKLHTACITTVTTYAEHEDGAKQAVTQPGTEI